MASLSEAVARLRAEYCEGCREEYSEEEILDGAQCDFCDRIQETGRQVAHLRD